jgi:hypothetical protein
LCMCTCKRADQRVAALALAGERRIRVLTLALPVTNDLGALYNAASAPAIGNLLAKMGARQGHTDRQAHDPDADLLSHASCGWRLYIPVSVALFFSFSLFVSLCGVQRWSGASRPSWRMRAMR